ncbi:LacI family DNA-binding transcriptional regulator [Microbacterium ureisolvens]|uniref:LacI family DNA-binding transcriptional regulator n=1 Tax=Microbacterium ureisolvens TaxID=2781186 RepID=A0ABS7I2D5_9MICO|nr:LacI family DNA-binding transcriptional regulator [Microbacterium ureisolvens]MBW9111483.1 LacI family DNA-binding transcriptional regulator [Microbacterium ureisolvens]
MAKSPTVEDVARAAGVSRQTVSNVINSPDIVREVTRERVRAAIAQLGYAPSMAARRLRTQRSATIGIHLDPYAGGISGIVLDRFIHALTDRATPRGLRILVYAANDAEEELRRIRQLREGGEIDRIVLTGTYSGDPRADWLAEHGIPFVAFGRPWGELGTGPLMGNPDRPWVDVDGAAGTRAATAHALAHGPRVAFLGWPEGSGTGDDRERGWREAMGDDAEEVRRLRWTAVDTVSAARAVAAQRLAAGGVDAIVCASDTLAVGAHLAASHNGHPDMLVVGFDNTPIAEALELSSVEQRPELVAEAVLDLLVAETGSYDGAWRRLIEPELIVRTREQSS